MDGLSARVARCDRALHKPRGLRVVDVVGDAAVLDALDGFVDDEERHEEPLAGLHRVAEAVLDLDVELRWAKHAVNQVLKLDAVEIVELVGGDYFNVGQEKSWVYAGVGEAGINPAASDANLVQDISVRGDYRIVGLAAQNVDDAEYLAVRAHLPAPWQDILDLAYYSGWRKNEILGLTWDELDEAGGVIRLSPARSKTLVGRILPISQPIAEALARRRARRDPDSPLVFHRDGIPIRRWRTAWRTACQAAGVPTRFLHDCRRTAARNLIRASVPERVAMLLTGHKTRAIFDRYNIINEQELLEAGDQLVAYLAQHAQATPRGGRPHPARTAAPRTAPPLRLVRRTTA